MRKGKVGLNNIGNTCYMSSGLQCLFHLRRTFEAVEENWGDRNGNGVFGEFAKLFRDSWTGNWMVLAPNRFKSVFEAAFKQFLGNDQHDCQEFLSYLLDRMHEELNVGSKKPKKIENIRDGMDEFEVAEVFWRNFCRRNSSFVSENFFGQYKSTILCDQGHKSLVFDPFLMVSLPIAKVDLRSFQFIFFKRNLKLPVFKCAFLGSVKSTVKDLEKFVCEVFDVDIGHLKVAAGSHEFIISGFLNGDRVLESNKLYLVYEVTGCWYLILTHRKRKVIDSSLSGAAVGYSRILSLEGSETLEDIHKVVYNSLKKNDKNYLKEFEEVLANQGKEVPFVYSLVYINIEQVCKNCKNSCKSCQVPVNTEKVIEKYCFSSTPPTLEVLWSKTLGEDDFRSIKSTLNHSSIDHVRKFIENSRKLKVDLRACIQEFSKNERLENSNRIFCVKCNELSCGSKKMEFWRLPKILIFHLKRFKQVQGTKIKDCQFVDFPVKDLRILENCDEVIYDLVSVANHYGDMNSGHYTSFAVNYIDQLWYEFDDESVSPLEPDQIVSPGAYILFYEQRIN